MHRGAEVTVVAAHTDVEPPLFVNVVPVQTAAEMYDAIVSRAQDYDLSSRQQPWQTTPRQ